MAEPPEDKAVQLLRTIRASLFYSWEDAERDNRLLDMVRDGIRYLERLAAGNDLTFGEGTDERRLLKAYCLYADSNQLDEFLENYLPELNTFQLTQDVLAYEARQEQDDEPPGD